ncbi:MAG: hypothetical protein L3J02_02900 [Henriciella sp.]|nr:hypothetical protein [Henriciella sp.]
MSAVYNSTPIEDRPDAGIVRVAATVDQVWALDADFLYQRLEVLKHVGKHYVFRIRMLDLISDILLVISIPATFFVIWWSFIPLVGFACLQRVANRRMAGELAAKAAQESTDAFLYLYNTGALWLERPRSVRSSSGWEHRPR